MLKNALEFGLLIGSIVTIIIPERSIGSGFWVRVRDFERRLYEGSKVESPRFFVKNFVTQVGGFDEEVVAYEESTLPQKLEDIGMDVNARITSLILHDEEGFDLRKWLNKKRYGGETGNCIPRNTKNMLKCNSAYRIEFVFSWQTVIGKS